MKKIFSILVFTVLMAPTLCKAQSLITDKANTDRTFVTMTSFSDYFPISQVVNRRGYDVLETIFNKVLSRLEKSDNFEISFVGEKNYEQAVSGVRRGKTDVLLGMYYATKMYSGLDYIFPAVLNNPVHVVMLPETEAKVGKVEDLQKLKGVYNRQEYFSDYVIKNFQDLGVVGVDNAEEGYRKLFSGEVDYLIGSYYYNYVKVCELGLKGYVTFSKQALWNMPMFIGVSKSSRNHKKVAASLKKLAESQGFIDEVNASLRESIAEVEAQTQGIVPPDFIKKDSGGILTPADEAEMEQQEAKR